MEVVMIFTQLLLYSVSEHSFLEKAISKLYLANTKEMNLFLKSKGKKAYKQKQLLK